MARNTKRLQRGTSLLEALLVTAVAGVLTTAAVPAMSGVMAHQRLAAGTSDLYATFNLARSEAIRRNASVAVSPADALDWSSGWKAFADRNDNGIQDADEETIVQRPAPDRRLTISAFFGATYPGKVLSYTGTGQLHRPGGQGLVIGRLVLAEAGGSRSLCFASLGMRIVSSAACS